MIEPNSNHFEVVADSLTGKRETDDRTLASLDVLTERLERLKALDEAFADVEFSDLVRKLQKTNTAVAVG